MDLTDFVVEPSPAFPTSDICSAAACQVATEQHHWPPWQFAPLQLTMRNVNDAWHHAKKIIRKTYLVRPSRNGEVREYPAPVTTCYLRPEERVLFDPQRNANPFFHFFESLWMLAGRNDVKWITQFLPRFGEYSDDGETFHGAYGYRWRHWFDLDGGAEEDFPDQLKKVIRLLKDGPHDRRIVLGMWDPRADLDNSRCKDLPCNTHVYFYVRDNALTMTVCCRSNDICLAGDTTLQSPEGDLPLRDLAKKFSAGLRRWPVYAVNTTTGDMRFQWCTRVWKTGKRAVIRVTFDDGTSLKCTPDHQLFLKTTRRGKQNTAENIVPVEAQKLQPGDRIWAPQIWHRNNRPKFKKNILQNTGYHNTQLIQGAYQEFVTGAKIPEGYCVHHKNGDTTDNRAENLETLSNSAHASLHRKLVFSAMSAEQRKQYNQKLSRMSKRAAEKWKQLSPAEKRARLERMGEKVRTIQKKRWAAKAREERTRLTANGIAAANAVTTDEQRREYGKRGLTSRWRDPEQRERQAQVMRRINEKRRTNTSNHKIVSIELLPPEDVYDFTVEQDHTALVGSGVLAHNCWGCYGANAVHFSVLHEYVARMTGYGVGPYYQMSNSWHLYMNVWDQFVGDTDACPLQDPYYDSEYAEEIVKPYPLVHHPESFDTELQRFVSTVAAVPIYGMPVLSPSVPNYNPFFLEVARPILRAFLLYKENKIPAAIKILEENCGATDWRLACQLWLTRIQNKRLQKQGSSSLPTDNES